MQWVNARGVECLMSLFPCKIPLLYIKKEELLDLEQRLICCKLPDLKMVIQYTYY